jgi:phosphoribosyl-ATP pyrophosphohydrolase
MTDNTVKEFSKTVGLPVARLIDQLELAGVNKKKEDDLISDEEKMQLLDYFRNINNVESDDNEEQDTSPDEIAEEPTEKKTKIVVRKKKVFSKVNNQVTEKIDPNAVKEEIEELIESVEQNSNTIHEAADVIYHLMVYLEANNVKIEDVMSELKKREK